ncbi:MAG: TetR/AcrR family transcriptional regulator [Acidimicrobiia bacterium]|nr:TetR/AcrR family transcriptional regulator [Acidimicrobiia bacterium]
MVVEPMRDRRAERREATKAEILDAAWELVRAEGLATLSLRDLARKVGMQAPSLYSYFESKHAIYDAMFLQGNLELLRRYEALPEFDDPVDEFRSNARLFVGFTVEDPARAQLMFMRSIPGFEPSAETYGVAVRIVERGRERFKKLGVTKPEHFDLWTGIVSGLAFQQIANEPDTERWTRLADEAVDMFLGHINTKRGRAK